MLKVVVDTNIWIRTLLGGPVTLPILEAWRAGRFQALISEPLLEELEEVWRRQSTAEPMRSSREMRI